MYQISYPKNEEMPFFSKQYQIPVLRIFLATKSMVLTTKIHKIWPL